MTQNLRIASCQFPVSGNIAGNAKFIRRFIKQAAESAADVVQFPETALSGYGRVDFISESADIWQDLVEHTEEIVTLAGNLGLWVVLGTCRKMVDREKPANCLQVISSIGQIVGTYDKQKLTASERAWYTPGNGFLVSTIKDVKCGFLICYEACFPALFEAYRKQGVQLIFHSCHNVSGNPSRFFRNCP